MLVQFASSFIASIILNIGGGEGVIGGHLTTQVLFAAMASLPRFVAATVDFVADLSEGD